MLRDCGGRGLLPDPPSPTGVNLLPPPHSTLHSDTSILLNLVLEKRLVELKIFEGFPKFGTHNEII